MIAPPPAEAPSARAIALSRTFGTRVAVSNLTLNLHAGEIVALLGPNGAGKTTTLRMLAGLIPPSSGEVHINGVPLTAASTDALRAQIGLLTETPGHWDRISVRMNLLTYARLYALPQPADAVGTALETVGLSDRANDLPGALSKGLRQRLAIARALMHQPSVLLLDEPTSGLDPSSARHVRNLITNLRDQGRAVIVSTHNLAEAEELADRIAVLKTALLAIDTPAALRADRKGVRVEIELDADAQRWRDHVTLRSGESITIDGTIVRASLVAHDRIPDVIAALVAAGARIQRVTPDARSLEDVYLSLVGASEGTA